MWNFDRNMLMCADKGWFYFDARRMRGLISYCEPALRHSVLLTMPVAMLSIRSAHVLSATVLHSNSYCTVASCLQQSCLVDGGLNAAHAN